MESPPEARMNKINLSAVPVVERRSPQGKYQKTIQEISVALGRDPESLDLARRHPFDLALYRVPRGSSVCPFHEHSAQWEMYLILSGHGTIRGPDCSCEIEPGDAILFPAGEAHQIINTAETDLVFYILADNPIGESCFYPDSGKWSVYKGRSETIVEGAQADYYAGEE